MRLREFVSVIFLLFQQSQILFSEGTACKCKSGEKQLKEIEELYNQKEYDKMDSILEKIGVTTIPCKQEVLFNRLQLQLTLNKMMDAETTVSQIQHTQPQKSCDEIKLKYHYHVGSFYIKTEKPEYAIQQFLSAKEIADRIKDTLMQIKVVSRIAFVFNKMQQPEKAIGYDHMELTLSKQMKDDKLILQAYSHMQAHFGVWYDITEDVGYVDSIKRIAAYALALAKETNLKLETAQTYSILAGVAYIENNYQRSLNLCDSGLLYLDRKKDFRHLFSIFTKKCDAYIEMKDYKKAVQYADSALTYAKQENNPLSIAFVYERMYELAKLQGDYSNALMFHEKFVTIRDSIRTIEKTEKINDLEQKYNKAQNEKTIRELNQEKQIVSLKNRIYMAGIIFAILIIILIVFFNRQRNLKNRQEILEAEQRLNRARMNPHFFFNTLNSLQAYSLQENKYSKVAGYLSKYAKIMRETLESTYKEMNTIEQETDYLNNYLEIQKLRYPDKFEYAIHIDENIEHNETYIPAMIIQPFIENSIEHAFDMTNEIGIIEINIFTENNRLRIDITDNGSGYKSDRKSKEYPSRAIQIINDRLMLLNKKYRSDASFEIGIGHNEKGTCVKIVLPLIHTDESFNN